MFPIPGKICCVWWTNNVTKFDFFYHFQKPSILKQNNIEESRNFAGFNILQANHLLWYFDLKKRNKWLFCFQVKHFPAFSLFIQLLSLREYQLEKQIESAQDENNKYFYYRTHFSGRMLITVNQATSDFEYLIYPITSSAKSGLWQGSIWLLSAEATT